MKLLAFLDDMLLSASEVSKFLLRLYAAPMLFICFWLFYRWLWGILAS